MKNIKHIIGYTIISLLIIINTFISGAVKSLEIIIFLIFYCVIFFLLHKLWKKLRKKESLNFINFIPVFIYKISIFLVFLISLIFAFSFYNNEISPAKMPEYTLTDGKKIVVFQSMSHIAKKSFYEEVKNNIENFKTNSGVLFFEGVKPGSLESQKVFNEALGVKFSSDLYKNMSKIYGITFQDNKDFLGIVNFKDYNVDLDLDEIVKIYNEKKKNISSDKPEKQVLDINDNILDFVNSFNKNELKIINYIAKSILNLIMKNTDSLKNLTENENDIFGIILDDRNKNLATEVEKSKYDKIYITYGALHFKGFFEILKKMDKNWQIVKIRNLYPLKSDGKTYLNEK